MLYNYFLTSISGERGKIMGNPLDSLKGTIICGLILTVVMVVLANAIAA